MQPAMAHLFLHGADAGCDTALHRAVEGLSNWKEDKSATEVDFEKCF